MDNKQRVLIASNRLPLRAEKSLNDEQAQITTSSGGLVSGLKRVHDHGDSLWFGCLGVEDATSPSLTQSLNDMKFVNVPIPAQLYDAYYNGYANGTLWPLFHNFLATMSISDGHWQSYVKANQIFAETLAMSARAGDLVWIHDYQLMLVPQFLRNLLPKLDIAYFHHIPFPSSEIFRTIPRRKELVTGLLNADYIGFHTFDYSRHFIQSCKRLLGVEENLNQIQFEDRSVRVNTHPLGVDFKTYDRRSSSAELLPERIEEKDHVTLLGIDRLDYTKGLTERLRSFGRFLELFPEFKKRARLIQICVPSREAIGSYSETKDEVERLVGKINGEHAADDYTPIEYMYRSLPIDKIISFYQTADIMLVTPLRDGLNLVCKEYIAARGDEDGCLILSEFAGAASEMGEALQVNPYDVETVAHTIRRALSLTKSDRKSRIRSLRQRLMTNDNQTWAENFLESWQRHREEPHPKAPLLLENLQKQIIDKARRSKRLFLCLDYDGTLVDIEQRPELAIPSQKLTEFLSKLSNYPNVLSSIITGRPRSFCEQHMRHESLTLIAEHGAYLLKPMSTTWEELSRESNDDNEGLKDEIMGLLNHSVQTVPGSHLEIKETCYVWHYREAEANFAKQQAQALSVSLDQLLTKTTWTVYPGKKSLEIRRSTINKGFAVEKFLLSQIFQEEEDLLICCGDDKTDEDMYRVMANQNVSIHVGTYSSSASFRVKTPSDLIEFLSKIISQVSCEKPFNN